MHRTHPALRTMSVAALLFMAAPGHAANVITESLTRLFIDSSQSTVQRIDGLSSAPLGAPVQFGGTVDVSVITYYIDTLSNGLPRTPTSFSHLSIDFVSLDLPAAAGDFAPGFLFNYFDFEASSIPGDRYDACSYAHAVGDSCSGSVIFSGHPGDYAGTFDGTLLQVTGSEAHGYTTDYYAFALVATPVPLAPGALLIAPALAVLLARRHRPVTGRRRSLN